MKKITLFLACCIALFFSALSLLFSMIMLIDSPFVFKVIKVSYTYISLAIINVINQF